MYAYLDDLIVIVAGDAQCRTAATARVLVTWAAGNAPVNFKKVMRGRVLKWCTAYSHFGLNQTEAGLAEERLDKMRGDIARVYKAKSLVSGVQQLAGPLSWVPAVLRLKPVVRPLLAATAAAARTDERIPRSAAWHRQMAATVMWLLRWAAVAARPSIERAFVASRPRPPLATVRTVASISGIGASLSTPPSCRRPGSPTTSPPPPFHREEVGLRRREPGGHGSLGDPRDLGRAEEMREPARVDGRRIRSAGRQPDRARVSSPAHNIDSIAEVRIEVEVLSLEGVVREHCRGIITVLVGA